MLSVMRFFMLCFLGIVILGSMTTVHGSIRRYRFELVNTPYTRLCTNRSILTVNGQFPGPTIYARRGDLIIVDLINRADQNISIHWHGVKMPRNPWYDGTSFITQCPVRPGTRFTQRITLSDEEGTLWWHAHINWSRATVHGAIIILPPKGQTYPFPKPHAQVPIILGEWWNKGVEEIFKLFLEIGRSNINADAPLINGQPGDLYPCSAQDTLKLSVELGKTYLMRLINANMNSILYFQIANHSFTMVGADGTYTKPLRTDYIVISPGQTMDFLLEANQPPSNYYMTSRVYSAADYIPSTAIIEYVGNHTAPSSPAFPPLPEYDEDDATPSISLGFTSQLRSLDTKNHPIVDLPKNITERMFVTLNVNEVPCTTSKCLETVKLLASMNNVSFILPDTTHVLHAYYLGINGVYTADFPGRPRSFYNFAEGNFTSERSHPKFGTAVKVLEYNADVEIVFQSVNFESAEHPMHIHGYSFYVVGAGIGNFNGTTDPLNYNLVDPPRMNTIVVPLDGWTTIRFKADNPGVWFLHCHLDRHQTWGMKMAFIVKDGKLPHEKMLPPPPDMPRCLKISSDSDQSPLLLSAPATNISTPSGGATLWSGGAIAPPKKNSFTTNFVKFYENYV